MAKVEKFNYRGEGNMWLVISDGQKSVYRLFKVPKNEIKVLNPLDLQQKQTSISSYVKHVMKPLIGEEYVKEGELVSFSKDEMRQIKCIVNTNKARPSHRLDKVLAEGCNIAVKLPDCCILQENRLSSNKPIFTVDIKPKCGFVYHPDAHLATEPESCENRKQKAVCKYCSLQYIKVKQGKYSKPSEYCPVDLFSGEKHRMLHAIRGLLRSPQNNLRVFLNGEQCFGEDCKDDKSKDFVTLIRQNFSTSEADTEQNSIDSFCDIIRQALLYSEGRLVNNEMGILSSERRDSPPRAWCDASAVKSTSSVQEVGGSPEPPEGGVLGAGSVGDVGALPEGCILRRLLDVQLLGTTEELIYPQYKTVMEKCAVEPNLRSASLVDGPYNQYLAPCDASDNKHFNQAVDKIKRFMVARTAMDVQIMISIQALDRAIVPAAGSRIVQSGGQSYQFEVSVVDLDPKPCDRIERYLTESREATQAYQLAQQ